MTTSHVHVLTVSTRDTCGLKLWHESLRASHFDMRYVRNLGAGQKWRGFRWRMKTYASELAEICNGARSPCGADCICILSDGEDVLFVGSMQETLLKAPPTDHVLCCHESEQLVGMYMQRGARELLSAVLRRRHPHSVWPALNAGLLLGTAARLLEVLQAGLEYCSRDDDQEALQTLALVHPHLLRVDHTARFFGIVRINWLNAHESMKDLWHCRLPSQWAICGPERRLQFVSSGEFPIALHFAGKVPLHYQRFLSAIREPRMLPFPSLAV